MMRKLLFLVMFIVVGVAYSASDVVDNLEQRIDDFSVAGSAEGGEMNSLESDRESSDSKKEQNTTPNIVVKKPASGSVETHSKKRPLKIEGKKILPLRVLARPFSNIYAEKDLNSTIIESNVPALKPYYVYSKPAAEDIELEDGWYQIGTNTRGKIVGWMQAKDLLEWKQTMCLVYTHPEGRRPVLMFSREADLQRLIDTAQAERISQIEKYYQQIESGTIDDKFPINSVEPKRALDLEKEFYFLPILDFKSVEFGNREARLLKLTASTNSRADAREATDIKGNKEYLNNANIKSGHISKEKLRKLKLDIVWVVDTTVSMRPYIDRTMEVVNRVSNQVVSRNALNASINFGIWGYRDNLDAIPKIGYDTKNYTHQLLPIDQFSQVLEGVNVTQVDSVDYPEDMFSGVNDAIKDTQWREDALRVIILVGDAPSHTAGHKWNISKLDEGTLRGLATKSGINIYSIHIVDPRASRFQDLAKQQFQRLADNDGMSKPAFEEVMATDKEQFERLSDDLVATFTDSISALKQLLDQKSATQEQNSNQTGGELAYTDEYVDINDALKNVDANSSQTKVLASEMFRAALVKWIGRQGDIKAPRDIVSWVIDKDLENSDMPSMEVRLLINKRELDSLATSIDEIITAGNRGMISGDDFFTSLQSTTAMMTRDPNMIKQAKRMVDFVPEFLQGLPYQSQLMAIDNDLWDSWSADEQNEFINSLTAKVEAYRKIHDSPEGWVPINPDDDPDEYVYPISLDLLP